MIDLAMISTELLECGVEMILYTNKTSVYITLYKCLCQDCALIYRSQIAPFHFTWQMANRPFLLSRNLLMSTLEHLILQSLKYQVSLRG